MTKETLEKRELTPDDLRVDVCYFGKRRKASRCYCNDRVILHVGLYYVQYDSDTVKFNSSYPSVTKEAFCKWAGGIVHREEETQ
jgi:hypothetical protein